MCIWKGCNMVLYGIWSWYIWDRFPCGILLPHNKPDFTVQIVIVYKNPSTERVEETTAALMGIGFWKVGAFFPFFWTKYVNGAMELFFLFSCRAVKRFTATFMLFPSTPLHTLPKPLCPSTLFSLKSSVASCSSCQDNLFNCRKDIFLLSSLETSTKTSRL